MQVPQMKPSVPPPGKTAGLWGELVCTSGVVPRVPVRLLEPTFADFDLEGQGKAYFNETHGVTPCRAQRGRQPRNALSLNTGVQQGECSDK